MNPDARMEAYLRDVLRRYSDDSLERAEREFHGLTPEEMQQPHGRSGHARQHWLDVYRAARGEHRQATAYLEALIELSRRVA